MDVKTVNYRGTHADQKFYQAIERSGFALFEHHPLSPRLLADFYELWYDFFLSDQKYHYRFDTGTHDGYITQQLSEHAKDNSVKDIKEFYHFYHNGRCPLQLRNVTTELFEELSRMGITLLTWLQQQAPEAIRKKFSIPLNEMAQKCPRTLLRIVHYPPLTGVESQIATRAAPHQDINLLTLTPGATSHGLEIQKPSQEWLSVPVSTNFLLANVGDMLQECSGDYFSSVAHRVVNPSRTTENRSLLSIELFVHAHDNVQLSERHTAQTYREERWHEIGLDETVAP